MLRRVIARGSTLDGTVPESAPTFAQRVGGRWVISWQAYTLGATVNTVLLGLTGGSVGAESVSLSDCPRWCALGALTSAVVGVYAFAANATVFRRKRQTPAALPVSVTFHASVGLVFAAVVIGLACATGAAVWAIDRFTSTGPVRLLLGIAVTAVTGGAAVAFFAPAMGAAGIGSVVVAVLLGSTIFVLLPASARTLRYTWRSTNARLNDIIPRKMHSQVDNAQTLASAASTIQFSAQLQPAVVACAAGLSQAARADGSARLTSALQWSAAVLEDFEDPGRGANLASELTSTVAPWLGLVSISLDVSPAAGRFGSPVSTTGGILLQEGLAFACGQAAAAHVTVAVHDNDGRIEFHIHHDGHALREQDLPPDARWRSANDGLDLVTTLTY